MTLAKQTPESELPRAIAEAMYGDKVRVINNGNTIAVPSDRLYGCYEKFNPWSLYKFYELIGNPETHAKICGVLHNWFQWFNYELEIWDHWWNNSTYLTENGGWRAWWLRAYLQVLLAGE